MKKLNQLLIMATIITTIIGCNKEEKHIIEYEFGIVSTPSAIISFNEKKINVDGSRICTSLKLQEGAYWVKSNTMCRLEVTATYFNLSPNDSAHIYVADGAMWYNDKKIQVCLN